MSTFNEQELNYMKNVFKKLASTNPSNEAIQNICSKFDTVTGDSITANKSILSQKGFAINICKITAELLYCAGDISKLNNLDREDELKILDIIEKSAKYCKLEKEFHANILNIDIQDKEAFSKIIHDYNIELFKIFRKN